MVAGAAGSVLMTMQGAVALLAVPPGMRGQASGWLTAANATLPAGMLLLGATAAAAGLTATTVIAGCCAATLLSAAGRTCGARPSQTGPPITHGSRTCVAPAGTRGPGGPARGSTLCGADTLTAGRLRTVAGTKVMQPSRPDRENQQLPEPRAPRRTYWSPENLPPPIAKVRRQEEHIGLEAYEGRDVSALHEAAAANDVTALGELLAGGAEIHAIDEYGCTPLHSAAARGRLDAVRALIEAGAYIDAPDADDDTPLHFAAHAGVPIAVLRLLIAEGADVHTTNTGGATPLHYAVSPARAAALLQAGAASSPQNERRRTPLHLAARTGSPATVRALLRGGADSAARDVHGRTPLHEAVRAGADPGVLPVLLAAGTDIETRDAAGRAPLHMAAHDASRPGAVRTLLARGATIETRDVYGATPLHAAAGKTLDGIEERTQFEIEGWKLAAGEEIVALGTEDGMDSQGKWREIPDLDAPRWHFWQGGDPFDWPRAECAALLLNAGADRAARTTDGRTTIEIAWAAGRATVVGLLLAEGAAAAGAPSTDIARCTAALWRWLEARGPALRVAPTTATCAMTLFSGPREGKPCGRTASHEAYHEKAHNDVATIRHTFICGLHELERRSELRWATLLGEAS